ncbi:hypothetical protein SteCoe_1120 [Stentor coeruleus]|uniref:Uncharacterized protein n=1 Tax=Stentor coeruleus TaxID=5963 RepID=A0A1R2D2S6_9CILI|nr:hypothetical protein SteCoe_1120 [Stentor coeruleus]
MNSGNPTSTLQIRHFVNAQKGGTGLYVFLLMLVYKNYNPGCWVYLGLHGTYGFVWLLKDLVFPDRNFEKGANFLNSIATIIMLLLYWIPAWLLVSGFGIQNPSPCRVALCIWLNSMGTALMIAADCQKYWTLKFKKGLIIDGVFKYTRSPNFLGEIMIYLSFAVCVGIWEVYLAFIAIWVLVLGTFIVIKEQSNSKKKGWNIYEQRTFVLLPKIVPSSNALSFILYFAATLVIYYLYLIV